MKARLTFGREPWTLSAGTFTTTTKGQATPALFAASSRTATRLMTVQPAMMTAVRTTGANWLPSRSAAVKPSSEKLLAAWERRCVVTECRVVGLLEAAHIAPHAEATDYRTSNGLLLRSDIHTLYDLGLLAIDQHMRVKLADELLLSEYRQYDGKKIERRPSRFADAPSHEALAKRYAAFLEKATSRT